MVPRNSRIVSSRSSSSVPDSILYLVRVYAASTCTTVGKEW